MNDLQKAYHALGLEPGALFEIVKRRYRRLALVWHPDRMTNAEAKREAEAEAAQRAAEANRQAQEKQKTAEDALSDESVRSEEALRWKCAIGIGITFITLISCCWVGCATRDFVHAIVKQWDAFQSGFKARD